MIVSLDWLRELCPVRARAEEIAERLTSRGLTVDALDRRGDDVAFDLDVPANRPDCLGHLGVARELSAAFGVPLSDRAAPPAPEGTPIDRSVRVRIEDPERCARYTARLVRGVTVEPSPEWVVRRLETCGLRSVNNVVDVSNLVLLELGQPIHTFDLARVGEGTIVVREGRKGEVLRTLDGEERRLDESMLVIADPARALALAGIIGGADSEIREETTDVLIESAWFDPGSVRTTARRLGVVTDASQRFGRGADPEAPPVSQDLAVRLLVSLAGGAVAPGILDERPVTPDRPSVVLRLNRVPRVLGWAPRTEAVIAAFRSLGLRPATEGDERIRVTVPSWRVDLEREEDLVEEVARHLGYEHVPSRLPTRSARPEGATAEDPEERCRDLLAASGFHEAFAYAMIGEDEDAPFVPEGVGAPLELTNPIADWISRLRRSLLPGLLRSADRNLRRGNVDVRLFEVGHVFLPLGTGRFPDEPRRLGIVWTGSATPRHWSTEDRAVDDHDIAGLVLAVARRLAPGVALRPVPVDVPGLHPGHSSCWVDAGGSAIGRAGALHPSIRDRLDLTATVWLAELDLDRLLASPAERPEVRPLPRVPAVSRDLSVVVPKNVAYGDVLSSLGDVEAPAEARFELIDRYEGDELETGSVSLTIRVVLQPAAATLVDEETEGYRARLVGVLVERFGARLRA